MNKKISIKDIAAHCGVSIATVSRVINGKEYVRQEIRLKVRDCMEDLGWKPNSLATRLSAESKPRVTILTGISGLAEPDIALRPLHLLVNRLYEDGYLVSVQFGHRGEILEQYRASPPPERILLLGINPRLTPSVKELVRQGVDILAVGEVDEIVCPTVSDDYAAAARSAALRLKEAGVKRPGVLCGFGAAPHVNDLSEIAIPRIRMLFSGVKKVYRKFDFRRDAVSDCFFSFTDFKEMLDSRAYDGWIVFGETIMNHAAKMFMQNPETARKTALLVTDESVSIPAFCRIVHACDTQRKIERIAELIGKPCEIAAHPIPFLGVNDETPL